jgi:succinate dehydrogenase/fumarate reductase flavoprotein subunit
MVLNRILPKEGETDMSSKEKEEKRISRRDFVRGAAVGAAGLVATGLAGCATPTPETVEVEVVKEVKPWMPEKWDYEADVVVVGTGFAGQATAIEAHDAGSSVLMLEKAPEEFQGGNSRVCGQGFIAPPKHIWDIYVEYFKVATAGQGFPIFPDEAKSDETLRFYIEESSKNIEWFESLGATPVEGTIGGGRGGWVPFYPQFPGAEEIAAEAQFYWLDPELGSGRDWYFLEDCVLERNIDKMYETNVKKLVQDPVTKEIFGVVAEFGGKDIYVKGKKAVVVCNGGWEFNQTMVRDFQGIPVQWSRGTPYNTGDGIKMCWAAGADLRNMSVIAAPTYLCNKFPEYESAVQIVQISSEGGTITVGANNKRWRNEDRSAIKGIKYRETAAQDGTYPGTGQIMENGVYVRDKQPLPMHIILDEDARLSGPFFRGGGMGWVGAVEGFEPSPDNSKELEMGWLIKADTIQELATKLGREADPLFARVPLQETIDRWNELCEAGEDTDWGRTQNLTQIADKGPYYAIEVLPCCLNTQGGMVRNIKSQVIDLEGNVIPRLYAAGENGDIFTWIYQCMSNVGGGCFGYGRVAGQNAAAETPWDEA